MPEPDQGSEGGVVFIDGPQVGSEIQVGDDVMSDNSSEVVLEDGAVHSADVAFPDEFITDRPPAMVRSRNISAPNSPVRPEKRHKQTTSGQSMIDDRPPAEVHERSIGSGTSPPQNVKRSRIDESGDADMSELWNAESSLQCSGAWTSPRCSRRRGLSKHAASTG